VPFDLQLDNGTAATADRAHGRTAAPFQGIKENAKAIEEKP